VKAITILTPAMSFRPADVFGEPAGVVAIPVFMH